MAFYSERLIPVFPLRRKGRGILLNTHFAASRRAQGEYRARGARFLAVGVDHNMGRKPLAKALRLISRNALAYGLARLMIDASQCCASLSRLVTNGTAIRSFFCQNSAFRELLLPGLARSRGTFGSEVCQSHRKACAVPQLN